ncbi:PP0621 family protein [uncultured Piscinibacter sp.]|uniref:PP0621 family protein n=1 Tax=uncultured Piscinibacter sp. TaxID=1131835 RepID=UPI002626B09C|nr:PP0621 family protein [uncultured Piscinibacter sp.]
MKYLLLIAAILLLVWLLRGSRRRSEPPPSRPRRDARAQPMVACRQCGVHLPQHEALPGRGGMFCGEAHRAEYEKQHPAG